MFSFTLSYIFDCTCICIYHFNFIGFMIVALRKVVIRKTWESTRKFLVELCFFSIDHEKSRFMQ